jgi:hypothetical protein
MNNKIRHYIILVYFFTSFVVIDFIQSLTFLFYLKVVVIDVLVLGIMFGVMLDMQEFL